MKNTLMKSIHQIRKNDVYLTQEIKNICIENFFPENTYELTLDLSNVTSAFFGLSLKNTIAIHGENSANIISEKIFYDLGRIKTQQCQSKLAHFPNDTRAFAYVVISAIFNASPEYTFEVIEFSPKETIIKLDGIDRYLRILSQLNIDQYVKFPTLVPFMEGIKDELQLTDCKIDFQYAINKEENKTTTTYKFSI